MPEVIENFRKQLAETIPGPVREADDLLRIPPEILEDILIELGIEEACEAMRGV